jgi:hypothetical protein
VTRDSENSKRLNEQVRQKNRKKKRKRKRKRNATKVKLTNEIEIKTKQTTKDEHWQPTNKTYRDYTWLLL